MWVCSLVTHETMPRWDRNTTYGPPLLSTFTPIKQGLLQHHYTLKPDQELGHVFRAHHKYQQSHSSHSRHGYPHHHADAKHAKPPAMEEGFEKALAAAGRRYQVDDLPRLYRRWKPLGGAGAGSKGFD